MFTQTKVLCVITLALLAACSNPDTTKKPRVPSTPVVMLPDQPMVPTQPEESEPVETPDPAEPTPPATPPADPAEPTPPATPPVEFAAIQSDLANLLPLYYEQDTIFGIDLTGTATYNGAATIGEMDSVTTERLAAYVGTFAATYDFDAPGASGLSIAEIANLYKGDPSAIDYESIIATDPAAATWVSGSLIYDPDTGYFTGIIDGVDVSVEANRTEFSGLDGSPEGGTTMIISGFTEEGFGGTSDAQLSAIGKQQ